jgi:hypothetical protein
MSAGVCPGTSSAVASTSPMPNFSPSLEQVVELATIWQEVALEVVELLEGGLDLADVLSDGDATADLLLQVVRRPKVVRVCMRLENPFDLQALVPHMSDHLVGRQRVGMAGAEVEVEHRAVETANAHAGARERLARGGGDAEQLVDRAQRGHPGE